jgi:hypothetical protein
MTLLLKENKKITTKLKIDFHDRILNLLII